MRYSIGSYGWFAPDGAWYAPGAVIDDAIVVSLAGLGPPIDALPLDQITYNYMISYQIVGRGYPPSQVRGAPGVVRVGVALNVFTLGFSMLGGTDVLG